MCRIIIVSKDAHWKYCPLLVVSCCKTIKKLTKNRPLVKIRCGLYFTV